VNGVATEQDTANRRRMKRGGGLAVAWRWRQGEDTGSPMPRLAGVIRAEAGGMRWECLGDRGCGDGPTRRLGPRLAVSRSGGLGAPGFATPESHE